MIAQCETSERIQHPLSGCDPGMETRDPVARLVDLSLLFPTVPVVRELLGVDECKADEDETIRTLRTGYVQICVGTSL